MADELSKVSAALADPTRRDIVARLAAGDATVGELAEPYDVTVQAVSKHLKVLEGAGLVTRGRDAQRRPVHLEANVLDLVTKWIERYLYRREAEARYSRLDDVLAELNDAPGEAGDYGKSGVMSTTTRYPRVAIEADPDVPLIRITRDFRGTPAWLLRAHVDPELFKRWNGPDSLVSDIVEWDARDGGSWRYSHRRGDEEYGFRGCFHTVREDRIVQTFTWEGMPDAVSPETLRFEDLGDRHHAADRRVAVRQLRGPRRLARLRAGDRRAGALRQARGAARRGSGLSRGQLGPACSAGARGRSAAPPAVEIEMERLVRRHPRREVAPAEPDEDVGAVLVEAARGESSHSESSPSIPGRR